MASPTFYSDGHTPNPRDTSYMVLQRILGAIIDNGTGGGGGSPPAKLGNNYSFSGSGAATTLRFKNIDTGLNNPVWTQGQDGVQSVVADNGQA